MQAARGTSLSRDDRAAGRTGAPRRRIVLFAVVAGTAYLLDVVTKVLAVAELSGKPPVTVVPEVLQLTLVRNPGAAFGVATDLTMVLSIVAIVICAAVIVTARRLRNPAWAVALGLLLGGALGNLTDRVLREPAPLRGHVVDFLQLPHWPVFNLADTWVCVAAAIIVIQSFRGVGLAGRPAEPRGSSEPDDDA